MKEDKVKEALKESLSKYKRLIRLFKKSKPKDQWKWFWKHCMSDTCPLCKIFGPSGLGLTRSCPLCDESGFLGCECCDEWAHASNASQAGKLTDWHLIAIYCRIERELEKVTSDGQG